MGYPIILKDVAIIILGAAVDEKTECCYTKTEKSQNGGYLFVFFQISPKLLKLDDCGFH